ncbi:hypothetical protein [Kitasatospora kifunensis]|uniref:Lipoprotein n=1 Tax=Kitasatospora kifunensis TaxID=58351 RepID=A0A7W7R4U9_KITKI|nr:hypothetical protein [Kitasatospora kifunensis]MBB4925265.1 hypothetical protein [Kitasatospora kifunensis]
MSSWLSRTLARWSVVPALAALAVLTGCADTGQLHDAGVTRPLTAPSSPPTPVALWAAVGTAPSPSAAATQPVGALTPVPGITVSGADLRSVDVRQLLRQDPQLKDDERTALAGCTGCQVLDPRYADLVGDGGAELITAVLTADQHAYLHVYQLRDHQVLAVPEISVLPGFTAQTVGRDLVVNEPTSSATVTSSTYRWDGGQLVRVETKYTGPDAAATPDCQPGVVTQPYPPGKQPRPQPSAAASAMPVAPTPMSSSTPFAGPTTAVKASAPPKATSGPPPSGLPQSVPSPSGLPTPGLPTPGPSTSGQVSAPTEEHTP